MRTQFPANYLQHLRSYRYRWKGLKSHEQLLKAVCSGQIDLQRTNWAHLGSDLMQNINTYSGGSAQASSSASVCTEVEAKRLIGQYAFANEMCFEHKCGHFLIDVNPHRETTWSSSWLQNKAVNGFLCFPKKDSAVLHHAKCCELVESSRWYHQALLGITQHNARNGVTIAVFNNSTLLLPNNCDKLSSVHVTYKLLGLEGRDDVLCSSHDVWAADRTHRLLRTVTEVVFLGPASFAAQLARKYGDGAASSERTAGTAATSRGRVKLNALHVVADACELTKDDFTEMQHTLSANTRRESAWLQELLRSRHTWRNATRNLSLPREQPAHLS